MVSRTLASSLRRTLLACAAALLALIAVEGVLLMIGIEDERFTRPDHDRGWALRAGFSGWATEENHLWVTINRDGMRDRERTREKPPRTIRVAVLGDSYIQAMAVPLGQTFTSQLEAHLARCVATGYRVEVLNFGVVGYGTAQELLTYRLHAASYQPDIVLTAAYFGNDVRDNYIGFDDDTVRPYFVREGAQLRLDNTFRQTLARMADQPMRIRWRMVLTGRFRTAALLYRPWVAFRDWQAGPETPVERRRWDEDFDALRPPDDDPDMVEAWRTSDAVFAELAAAVRAGSAEPWVATLTVNAQVDPNLQRRAALQQQLGVDDLYYAERRMTRLGETQHFGVIALAPELADHTRRTGEYLNGGAAARTPPGSGHFNATGHRLAAEIVGARLCKESAVISRARRTD